MSALLALSAAHYINMKNNAAMSMMNINNARMGMLCAPNETAGGIACSPETLCAMDTQMELDAMSSSIQYQFAKAMLEQIKKQQKEDAKRLNLFA